MILPSNHEELKKDILSFVPKKIIDAHIHTATCVKGPIDPAKKEPHPLSFRIMDGRVLNAPLNLFDDVFPDSETSMVGFPLPLPFANENPERSNQELMVEEMKKGVLGLLTRMDMKSMEEAIGLAKKAGVRFRGIKFHPRMFPAKPKHEVLLTDIATDDILEFCEKEKLAMLLELSHGIADDDIGTIKRFDSTFNVKIVYPHLTYNHKGFVMSREEYDKSSEEYDKQFRKISGTNNAFFDTSMVVNKAMVRSSINTFGEDRIIYGTDFPFGFTQKIREFRPDNDTVANALKNLIDGKDFKERWQYDYNIYLQVKAIKDASEALNLDSARKIMFENAKKVYDA